VIDAGVLLALVLREPHAEAVSELLDEWDAEGVELHAPLLTQYEVASVLTRRRVRDGLSAEDAAEALSIIDALDVTFDPTLVPWRSPSNSNGIPHMTLPISRLPSDWTRRSGRSMDHLPVTPADATRCA
jgi:PIN domain-containing protein